MVKSANTEEKILSAARIIFVKKGYAGARMQEIANEAEINKALLHYYFRSKEKLFERIFNDVFQSITSGIGRLSNSDQPTLKKLEELISMYVDAVSANPYMPVFILNEMNQNPDRMTRVLSQGIFPSMMGFITELFQEMNLGKIRAIHPMHLIMNIMGMIILPYAGKAMLEPVFKDKLNIDFDDVLAERKSVITKFVFNALQLPEN